ncbi:MAG: TIGR02757 family protein [Bacteroidales bacterium]|nr:TIGR02757 family protein [Bacteroidales bacterium]
MVSVEDARLLRDLALKYETTEFISDDPVSFPHRYKEVCDIEISAFIAQWLAYGKREMFLRVLDMLGQKMGTSPHLYIKNRGFEEFKDDDTCLYRFYKKRDLYFLCSKLHEVYFECYGGGLTMQEVLKKRIDTDFPCSFKAVLECLASIFGSVNGIPDNTASACKRLCMFLRWMVRKSSPVDFGLWNIVKTEDLIIPLDTHVFQQSKRFNLTMRKNADFKTAVEITEGLKQIFPNDPVRADFALFGYGVNNKN